MKTYDVIIVGAGPGGLRCAEILSKTKLKVLLLEKNKIIGPKVCAGGLPNRCVTLLKIPDKLLDFKFKQGTIHTPLTKTIIKSNHNFIYTVDRKNLGQWQLNKLRNTKVVVKTNSKVTQVQKNHLVVNGKEKFKFKYLVGADGANSKVRKYLGLETNKIHMVMQYIIPTKKYKKIEAFYNESLFRFAYAWIFPHKNYASIGCGYLPQLISGKKTRKNFNKWLKKNKIDVSKGKFEAAPINYDFQNYKFGNIFLIGDAAGLASGITGEGIYQAVVSGEEIAKKIINKKYNLKKIQGLIKLKKRSNKTMKAALNLGPFRMVAYECFNFLLKTKRFLKKFLREFE